MAKCNCDCADEAYDDGYEAGRLDVENDRLSEIVEYIEGRYIAGINDDDCDYIGSVLRRRYKVR